MPLAVLSLTVAEPGRGEGPQGLRLRTDRLTLPRGSKAAGREGKLGEARRERPSPEGGGEAGADSGRSRRKLPPHGARWSRPLATVQPTSLETGGKTRHCAEQPVGRKVGRSVGWRPGRAERGQGVPGQAQAFVGRKEAAFPSQGPHRCPGVEHRFLSLSKWERSGTF